MHAWPEIILILKFDIDEKIIFKIVITKENIDIYPVIAHIYDILKRENNMQSRICRLRIKLEKTT